MNPSTSWFRSVLLASAPAALLLASAIALGEGGSNAKPTAGTAPPGTPTPKPATSAAPTIGPNVTLLYELAGHVEKVGNITATRSEWLGTKGKGLRLEAIAVKPQTVAGNVESWPSCLQLEYQVRYPDTGLSGWYAAPTRAGTSGKGQKLNGVAFRLTGTCKDMFTVEYNCHVSVLGDQSPVSDGKYCGGGNSHQLEAITVSVRSKPDPNASVPGKSTVSFGVIKAVWATRVNGKPVVMDSTEGPDTWMGTKGQGIQLTTFGVKPNLTATTNPWPSCLSITYMAHVSNVGDTPWYIGPQPVTGGLEGVAFRLGGTCANQYTVEYQCHLQGYGDRPMVSDGVFCGTRGEGRRLEALKLTVRKK
jgi:hypothetical protein